MISRQEKERQLIESGMFDSIKAIFIKNNIQISDKYLMLITDYIDTLGQLDYENGLYLDPIKVAQELPELLKKVKEEPLGVYGVTDNFTITMNSRNDYETNKIIRYTEEFIFEKGSIKRITTYDNKTYIDTLPEFDKEDLYRFIDEKVSEIRGNNIKR